MSSSAIHSRAALVSALLASAVLIGCVSELGELPPAAAPLTVGQTVQVLATVRYVKSEKGCWVLATSAGRYEPVDLPVGFRVEGRVVNASLRGAPEGVSTCMAGPLVHVDSIARTS